MKTTTITTRTFEIGDMFIFTGAPVSGDAYTQGDFLLIQGRHGHYDFRFTTSKTITGKCKGASGDAAYLSRELDAGVLEYQGNVKVGV
ncbi:hypothetical protein vBAspABolek_17 [Aeromonas phage vB_AspA_Bolek]|nr:hypothetical protein vBAspABolek_17 [Aeromonas phage vB_AspA_Bolek]